MRFVLEIAGIVFLGIVAYQDFRYRLISALIVGMLLLTNAIYGIWQVGIYQWFYNSTFNILLVLMELSLCWLLLSLVKRKKIQLADNYLGWGDILFFAVMASMFCTSNFILILPLSLLAVLFLFLSLRLAGYTDNKIPLAGVLAMIVLIIKGLFIAYVGFKYYEGLVIIS